MKKRYLVGLACGVMMLGMARVSQATPIQWAVSDGGNGHWYEAVYAQNGIDWYNAKSATEIHGGYLATVSSATENSFLFGLVTDYKYWTYMPSANTFWGPWIGGSWNSTNGWSWVTGEAWTYDTWDHYQSSPGGEILAHFHGSHGQIESHWNDINNGAGPDIRGYLVEYNSAPVPESQPPCSSWAQA